MLLVLINVLITIVVGAILFGVIDKLVVLICLEEILHRILPLLGMGGVL
jgi:hypothetical protein